jgi:hypothetical protein
VAAIGTVMYKLEVEDDTSARSVTWAGRPGRPVWARRMRPSWVLCFFYSSFSFFVFFVTFDLELQLTQIKFYNFIILSSLYAVT